MPTQRVAIPGALGHPLAGQLERPDPAAFPEPLAWALLAHCFTCGKDLKSLVRLARALMVFHSPSDESLELEEALAIFDQAAQPKSFVTLPGADHLLFRDERDAVFVADVIAAWVRRHL